MTQPYSADLLQRLIQCPSVTPAEGGALVLLEKELKTLGFSVDRVTFSDSDTPDVENLYARYGNSNPHLMFAGHTDVVPTGSKEHWRKPPFSGEILDGNIYGRGAVDMKGGIAAFIAAVRTWLKANSGFSGSISLLITGDEEGPAINGTDKLLQWAKAKGETWDGCVVGEPTNPDKMGDVIKIGRRGSISGEITVQGIQGHVAYPHLADNPVRAAADILKGLMAIPLDQGTDHFQPSNLEVTAINTDVRVTNVIPGSVTAMFNIRFNDLWTIDTVKAEVKRRLDEACSEGTVRSGLETPAHYELKWLGRPSDVFRTVDDNLIGVVSKAVEDITGRTPQLTTGGGTSDARFIKDYCPVVEFGLVGKTMHQIDECASITDLELLEQVYVKVLDQFFAH